MKLRILILVLLILFSTYSLSFGEELSLVGEGAILMDYDTMEVLYEKNPHTKLYPASTTKIMTAILTLELGNLKDTVTIDQEIVSLTDGSHIALEPGEQLVLEDLLNALLIESANDAALAIAKHISGSISGFVQLMNDKAKELGALNTNFINPNGLHDDAHVSTPYDLALIGRYAMENEMFREIVNNYNYSIQPTNKKTEARHLKSANRLLYSTNKINVNNKSIPIKLEGVNGVKTGYTQKAQNCLVTSYEKDGHKLIAVVLKSNGIELYADIHKLIDYGVNNFHKVSLGYKNEFVDNINIPNGTIPVVAGVLNDGFNYPLSTKGNNDIKKKVILKEDLEAPLSAGEILGQVEYLVGDKSLGFVDIISTMDIEMIPKPTFLQQILKIWFIIVPLILIMFRTFILLNRRKRRRRRSIFSA